MDSKGLFIAGDWQKGEGASYHSTNPHTLEPVFTVCAGDSDQVERAVESAYKGYFLWRSLSIEERISHLDRLAQAFKELEEKLALAICQEMGKLYSESLGEAKACSAKIQATIEEALPWVKGFRPEGLEGACHFKPMGPMAVIGPYNYPAHLANGHIVAALLMGNTVIFKPSSTTPWVGEIYAEAFDKAKIPAGVFNLLQIRRTQGDQLLSHPKIRGILFTGSWNVGLHIKKLTLEDPWKILALEMGGKNCAYIHEDADLEQSLEQCWLGAFLSTGQRCTGTSRILVHDKHYDRFKERLVEMSRQTQSGDPMDPKSFMGPLATRGAFEEYQEVIRYAEEHPSRYRVLTSGLTGEGYGVQAAVIEVLDFDPQDMLIRDESFAPIVLLERVSSLEESLERACESDYGLSYSVFCKERSDYERCLEAIDCGIINWNRATCGASGRLPFGGLGRSGNHRPAALFAPQYCSYPVAELRMEYGALQNLYPKHLENQRSES